MADRYTHHSMLVKISDLKGLGPTTTNRFEDVNCPQRFKRRSLHEHAMEEMWKAFKDKMPKSEFLRFKAASNDYFLALVNEVRGRPVVRVCDRTGQVYDAVRAYAHTMMTLRWLYCVEVGE